MRETAFRAFLVDRIGATAVASYMSNMRAVERTLGIDLDETALHDDGIAAVQRRLRDARMPAARVRDCGSALRHYSAFRRGAGTSPLDARAAANVGTAASGSERQHAPPVFLAEASIADLMRLYADVMEELRRRKVTRTANGPVGDYAELLFSHAFGWTLCGNSASHYDAEDDAGIRYQIKARRATRSAGTRQLGALRRLPDHGFDVLAAVLFDRDMQVLRAALIPYDIVVERAMRVDHTNSWRFMLNDAVWDVATVRDATLALRDAARKV